MSTILAGTNAEPGGIAEKLNSGIALAQRVKVETEGESLTATVNLVSTTGSPTGIQFGLFVDGGTGKKPKELVATTEVELASCAAGANTVTFSGHKLKAGEVVWIAFLIVGGTRVEVKFSAGGTGEFGRVAKATGSHAKISENSAENKWSEVGESGPLWLYITGEPAGAKVVPAAASATSAGAALTLTLPAVVNGTAEATSTASLSLTVARPLALGTATATSAAFGRVKTAASMNWTPFGGGLVGGMLVGGPTPYTLQSTTVIAFGTATATSTGALTLPVTQRLQLATAPASSIASTVTLDVGDNLQPATATAVSTAKLTLSIVLPSNANIAIVMEHAANITITSEHAAQIKTQASKPATLAFGRT